MNYQLMLLPPETAKKTIPKKIPKHAIIATIAIRKRMAISFDKSTDNSSPRNASATNRQINNVINY